MTAFFDAWRIVVAQYGSYRACEGRVGTVGFTTVRVKRACYIGLIVIASLLRRMGCHRGILVRCALVSGAGAAKTLYAGVIVCT